MNTPRSLLRIGGPLAAVFLALCSSARADTELPPSLVSYQFTNGGTPAAATSKATGLSASNASWSYTIAGTQMGFGGTHNSAFGQASALPTSFDDTKYLTFTLTANEGMRLNLTSFSFDLGGNASSTGGKLVEVFSQVKVSLNGGDFGSALVVAEPSTTVASYTIPTENNNTVQTNRYTIVLSGEEYQGLESISFRLLVATDNTGGTRFLRFDNFDVHGAVVEASSIPEPSTAAWMAGVVALGFVAGKRRRRSA